MGDLLLAILPYGLAAAAAAPAAAVVSALILGQAQRKIMSALIFVCGALLIDAGVGVLLLSLMEASGQFNDAADIAGWVDALLGVIFLGIGVMAFFQAESPEKSAAQRARIEGLVSSGPVKLLVLGVVVAIVNSDSLAVMAGGLKEIATSNVPTDEAGVALLVLVLLMLLPYYIPIVMFAIAPRRASVLLGDFSNWLLEHSRIVEIVTGFVLGGIFLVKGLAALA